MALRFEWDAAKAAANVRKHRVSFDEASTVFGDPCALIVEDPRHSDELRSAITGTAANDRLLTVMFTERGTRIRLISARRATRREEHPMKKRNGKQTRSSGRDDILPEYDFSHGRRNKYAAKYREGTNIVVLNPDVAELFPTSEAVNRALRALGGITPRRPVRPPRKRRTA